MSPERELAADVARRAHALFGEMRVGIFRRTDKLFAGLFVFQWLAGIVAALLLSPTTWAGEQSQIHIHVWAAIFLGGAIAMVPLTLVLMMPGLAATRHVIAIAQMLTSGLLIDLTRRPYRDSLPLFRIAGLPGLLSRLARADNRLDCRGRGPYLSRELFPAIDVWSDGGAAVAMGRTYRMGRVRGLLSDHFDRAEPQGDERDCGRSRAAGNGQRGNRK